MQAIVHCGYAHRGSNLKDAGRRMKALPEVFSMNQFAYRQISRIGNVALYQKTKHFSAWGLFKTYEVVVVQKMEKHIWPNGDITPAHEHMPGNEQWGLYGWSCQTHKRALKKFQEVVNIMSIVKL
jgi:hypothetical protein